MAVDHADRATEAVCAQMLDQPHRVVSDSDRSEVAALEAEVRSDLHTSLGVGLHLANLVTEAGSAVEHSPDVVSEDCTKHVGSQSGTGAGADTLADATAVHLSDHVSHPRHRVDLQVASLLNQQLVAPLVEDEVHGQCCLVEARIGVDALREAPDVLRLGLLGETHDRALQTSLDDPSADLLGDLLVAVTGLPARRSDQLVHHDQQDRSQHVEATRLEDLVQVRSDRFGELGTEQDLSLDDPGLELSRLTVGERLVDVPDEGLDRYALRRHQQVCQADGLAGWKKDGHGVSLGG